MRGDFEVDNGGYPIAAMPNPEVKGESYIMDVRTMNKLLDARNIPTKLASHVAAVLNAGLRAKRYASEWAKLNQSSLEVYEQVIDPTEGKSQAGSTDSSSVQGGPDTPKDKVDEPTSNGDGTGVEALVSNDSPTEESTPEIVLQNPASAESNAALAAIIAEAGGDDTAQNTTATEAKDGVSQVHTTSVPTAVPPPSPVVPAIAPLQAPAK